MSQKPSSLFRFLRGLVTFIIVVVLLFIGIGAFTASDTNNRLFFSAFNDWSSQIPSEVLIYAMGTENPYFTQGVSKDSHLPSLSSVILELSTNIKTGDIRSLLGNELPGFSIFDTEIAVPGEGTDYTNLVNESAPPLDEMLRERKEAEQKLNEWQDSKKDEKEKKTPPKTTEGKKIAYIYHTHSWESYLPILGLSGAKDANKASDAKTNVSSIVGKELTRDLKREGIGTLHDTQNMGALLKQKGWAYPQAYKNSRSVVEAALNKNKSLDLLIDIHRDSSRKKITTKTLHKKSYARATFVIGGENPHYQQNLQFAKALHHGMEDQYPGISRGVLVKSGNGGNGLYNQDLSPHAVLIEVGGVDNSLDELNRTVKALADVISYYYWHNVEK